MKCKECNGSGRAIYGHEMEMYECYKCRGTGTVSECPFCDEDEKCPGQHIFLDTINMTDEELAKEGLQRIPEPTDVDEFEECGFCFGSGFLWFEMENGEADFEICESCNGHGLIKLTRLKKLSILC